MFGFGNPKTSEISPSELAQMLETPGCPYLLDVREPGEFSAGRVPGSALIPLGELAARIDELPKDREIVAICRSGARSGMACQALSRAGLQARNMAGGLLAWRGPVER